MDFIQTKLKDAWLIKPKVFYDERGFFLESFLKKSFEERSIPSDFVQDNHSRSLKAGVLRGMHFQKSPRAQAKLVRVVRGAIFDVIVDLRRDSETFGKWEGFDLTEKNFMMLYVPRGFAHGFCALEPSTDVLYKIDDYYFAEYESGIIWKDSVLAIRWPVDDPILSEKDAKLPAFDPNGLFF